MRRRASAPVPTSRPRCSLGWRTSRWPTYHTAAPAPCSIFPDLPPSVASGGPGYTAVSHYGMVAPAGTDRAIVDRLNSKLRAALNHDDVRARIAEEGGEALPGTPDQQANDMEQEEAKWGALVRRLGSRW